MHRHTLSQEAEGLINVRYTAGQMQAPSFMSGWLTGAIVSKIAEDYCLKSTLDASEASLISNIELAAEVEELPTSTTEATSISEETRIETPVLRAEEDETQINTKEDIAQIESPIFSPINQPQADSSINPFEGMEESLVLALLPRLTKEARVEVAKTKSITPKIANELACDIYMVNKSLWFNDSVQDDVKEKLSLHFLKFERLYDKAFFQNSPTIK
jgi:hypothetical protein